MVTRIAIDPLWLYSDKICFPIKRILARMQAQEYISVGAVIQELPSDDILFLRLLFRQHMDEIMFYSRAGINPTSEMAVYNITVLVIALLHGEGVSEVDEAMINKAKVRLGAILRIESDVLLYSLPRMQATITLKRTNYNLSSEKDLKFMELKDES